MGQYWTLALYVQTPVLLLQGSRSNSTHKSKLEVAEVAVVGVVLGVVAAVVVAVVVAVLVVGEVAVVAAVADVVADEVAVVGEVVAAVANPTNRFIKNRKIVHIG